MDKDEEVLESVYYNDMWVPEFWPDASSRPETDGTQVCVSDGRNRSVDKFELAS